MASQNRFFAALRLCVVGLVLLNVFACDSDGDARHLSNLVTVADQEYVRIEILDDAEVAAENTDADAVTEVDAPEATLVIEVGQTTSLSVRAFTADSAAYATVNSAIWSSSNSAIASVASDGTVVAGEVAGSVDISANFGNLIKVRTVRVSSALLKAIKITTPDSNTVNECSANTLVAKGVYEGEEDLPARLLDGVVWTVSGSSAASFSENGLLRVTAAGQLSVAATKPETVRRPPVRKTADITVRENLESIAIEPSPGRLAVGSPLQYRAIPTYQELPDEKGEITDNVEWALDDSATSGAFARVENTLPDKGLVTATRFGDGRLSAECSGTVVSETVDIRGFGSDRLTDLQISPLNPQREFPLNVQFTGEEKQEVLIAKALYGDQPDGLDVTMDAEWTIEAGSDTPFSIGNDNDNKGVLKINGVGTVKVKAAYTDTENNDALLSDIVTITSVQ